MNLKHTLSIRTSLGRFIASFCIVSLTAFVANILLGGMSEFSLRSTFGFFQWFLVAWNYDHTAIGQAVGYSPLLATAVVLGSAARWTIATAIATSWFLFNTLLAVFFCLTFDPKA